MHLELQTPFKGMSKCQSSLLLRAFVYSFHAMMYLSKERNMHPFRQSAVCAPFLDTRKPLYGPAGLTLLKCAQIPLKYKPWLRRLCWGSGGVAPDHGDQKPEGEVRPETKAATNSVPTSQHVWGLPDTTSNELRSLGHEWVSCNSAQFTVSWRECQVPRVQSSGPQDCPPPQQVHTVTWASHYRAINGRVP